MVKGCLLKYTIYCKKVVFALMYTFHGSGLVDEDWLLPLRTWTRTGKKATEEQEENGMGIKPGEEEDDDQYIFSYLGPVESQYNYCMI